MFLEFLKECVKFFYAKEKHNLLGYELFFVVALTYGWRKSCTRIFFILAAAAYWAFLFSMPVSRRQRGPPQMCQLSEKSAQALQRSLCSVKISSRGAGICKERTELLFLGGVSLSSPLSFCVMLRDTLSKLPCMSVRRKAFISPFLIPV